MRRKGSFGDAAQVGKSTKRIRGGRRYALVTTGSTAGKACLCDPLSVTSEKTSAVPTGRAVAMAAWCVWGTACVRLRRDTVVGPLGVEREKANDKSSVTTKSSSRFESLTSFRKGRASFHSVLHPSRRRSRERAIWPSADSDFGEPLHVETLCDLLSSHPFFYFISSNQLREA